MQASAEIQEKGILKSFSGGEIHEIIRWSSE